MDAPPVMKSERLVLRTPDVSDAEALFREYASDTKVTRYLSWPTHGSVADTEEFLRTAEQWWSDRKAFTWVLQVDVNLSRAGPPVPARDSTGSSSATSWPGGCGDVG